MIEKTLLIFDIDGTLLLTKEIGDQCFIDTFEQVYQCSLGNLQWEDFTNVTDSALFIDLYHMTTDKLPLRTEIYHFKKAYYNALLSLTKTHTSSFTCVEGAKEFLQYCQLKKWPTAIATGSWREIATLKISTCNLPIFDLPIATSDDSHIRTQIITSAIEKSMLQYRISHFDQIFYFGDGIWDKKSAEALGLEFIGIDTENNGSLKKSGVVKVFRNFNELDLW